MSHNLYWKLDVQPRHKTLPDQLKYRLRDMFGFPVHVKFDRYKIDVIKALEVCGVEGAKELRELVEQHGTIVVWEAE